MDRNILSDTELVHRVIADPEPFTNMLSSQDRSIFGKLSEYALNSQAATPDDGDLLPLETTLLILLLEEHRWSQRIYSELCAEIERLKGVAQQLQEIPVTDENTDNLVTSRANGDNL